VFENLVVYLLDKYLGDYIENLDTKKLKIDLWSGELRKSFSSFVKSFLILRKCRSGKLVSKTKCIGISILLLKIEKYFCFSFLG
jgi:hypothetical protein